MDFYQLFKQKREELKEKAIGLTLDEGRLCWTKHHSKRKADYNDCSKKSVHVFHVFSDGKRRIKDMKILEKSKCEKIPNPLQLKACKLIVYENLLKDLESLDRKIDREYKEYKESSYT